MYIIYILIASLLMSLTIVGISYVLYMIWLFDMVKAVDSNDPPEVLLILFVTFLVVLIGSLLVYCEYMIAVQLYMEMFL